MFKENGQLHVGLNEYMCRAGHTQIAVSIFTLNKLPSGQANNVVFCSFVKVREDFHLQERM